MIVRDVTYNKIFCPFTPPALTVEEGAEYRLSFIEQRIREGIALSCYEIASLNGKCHFEANFNHDTLHFLYIHDGNVLIKAPELEREYGTGEILLVHSKELIHFTISQPASFIMIECASGFGNIQHYLANLAPRDTFLLKTAECNEEINVITQSISIYSMGNRQSAIYLEAKGMELLTLLMAHPEIFQDTKMQGYQPNARDIDALEDVAEHIRQNLGDDYSIEKISRLAGLNEFKLKNGFKYIFKQTVFSFLRSERMLKAKELLAEGDKSVIEVANEVGYSNPSHFSRSFKAEFGILPKAFQQGVKTSRY